MPATGTGAGQNEKQPARTKKVVVLDPGHGGHDMGAGKPGDIYEKEVALLFASLLADKLKPAYTVHLTRSDDYQIDLMHRPAVANHLEADLFLSIHTGASTLHNPNGMLLAYYDNQFRLTTPHATTAYDSLKKEDALPSWDEKSAIQVEKSKKLARLLKEKILEYDQEIKIDIQGMPLVVLEGADQPALLIEIGYLTNPADLRKLKNNSVLESYTNTISAALKAYFSDPSDM
ncbi:MAG: N-acetylmuramoyl-L-alanine amidase [Thermodesulfobacteriota bacterium]